jgi:shikimate dehydrogenase
MTSNFAVVGSPIAHSLSPLLHQAAYSALGFDASYSAHEVVKGELAAFLSSNALAGVSVTMPLKEEAFELAVSKDEPALITGACNTLVSGQDGYRGFNTDVYGIRMALREVATTDQVALIGTGATARSILVALQSGAQEVSIWGRDAKKVEDQISFASGLGMRARAIENLEVEVSKSQLVISALPAGVLDDLWRGMLASSVAPSGALFDVAYHPWPSVAAEYFSGNQVIAGIEMLKWQAVEQVRLFVSSVNPQLNIDPVEIYNVMDRAVSAK